VFAVGPHVLAMVGGNEDCGNVVMEEIDTILKTWSILYAFMDNV
jgi:hypothetical protein